MKKIYMILGNKPFEDKLIEQLSHHFKPVGNSDNVGEKTVVDIFTHGVDTLIIRESMAENEVAFFEFLKEIKERNVALKVVAIVQQRPFGDEYLFRLAKIGVYDIINGGTRLSDVIEMSLRELSLPCVFPIITPEQQQELEALSSVVDIKTTSVNIAAEDDVIEINGELPVEENNKLTGFKERYLNGITQVYSPIDESDEVGRYELPVLKPNDLLLPVLADKESAEMPESAFGFNLPGQRTPKEETLASFEPGTREEVTEVRPATNDDELENMVIELSETMDIRSQPAESAKSEVVATITKEQRKPSPQQPVEVQSVDHGLAKREVSLTLHLVFHGLLSSVAMQYAVSRAKTKTVGYIETDSRNQVLQATCEKRGVRYHWTPERGMIKGIIENLLNEGIEEIILNTQDATLLSIFNFKHFYCEILQDKEQAVRTCEALRMSADGKVVVAYYEPDLISVKTLSKTYARTSFKWANTRVEEYNSRLNAKLPTNETVSELTKEG